MRRSPAPLLPLMGAATMLRKQSSLLLSPVPIVELKGPLPPPASDGLHRMDLCRRAPRGRQLMWG
ncbi:hypothetical protein C8Q77DRAFT_1083678 [Trametes polyzona]|nr:hypothetical protein C8Q77DRAFT_1083678 [Trametes polyzona]